MTEALVTQESNYYLVAEQALPEAIILTAKANQLLQSGVVSTVKEAVEKVGISRSVYYKYKDSVQPFQDMKRECIVTISMELQHRSGVLSNVLGNVVAHQGNVLTINQTMPLQGLAIVTLTIEAQAMSTGMEKFIGHLLKIDGVQKARIVGYSN